MDLQNDPKKLLLSPNSFGKKMDFKNWLVLAKTIIFSMKIRISKGSYFSKNQGLQPFFFTTQILRN